MPLDDDALSALWSIYDASGIRPEYLIPVLQFESGLDPTRGNAAGAPFYGIAQTSAAHLAALGVTPAAFLAMTAGNQIRTAVAPYFAGVVKSYGPIRSATRAEQANFLPATLPTVRALGQILVPTGSRTYTDNAAAFDPFHRGAITLSDLAYAMARAAAAPGAQAATARAYVLRPAMAPPYAAIYGQDFVDPAWGLGAVALGVLAALR